MIKSYDEMRKVDISQHIDQRDGYDYLNWARCIDLLHEHGAKKVYFEPCVNEKGSSLFMSDQVFTDRQGNTNRCYEVRVHIVIDDLEFDVQYPLMNGSNPVKDNSLTQQRVWNAQTRAFVKGVAMRTGLGFDLWVKNMDEIETETDLSKHSLAAIRERFEQHYTRALLKKMTAADIAKACDLTVDEAKMYFTYFDQLERFEQKLMKL